MLSAGWSDCPIQSNHHVTYIVLLSVCVYNYLNVEDCLVEGPKLVIHFSIHPHIIKVGGIASPEQEPW